MLLLIIAVYTQLCLSQLHRGCYFTYEILPILRSIVHLMTLWNPETPKKYGFACILHFVPAFEVHLHHELHSFLYFEPFESGCQEKILRQLFETTFVLSMGAEFKSWVIASVWSCTTRGCIKTVVSWILSKSGCYVSIYLAESSGNYFLASAFEHRTLLCLLGQWS